MSRATWAIGLLFAVIGFAVGFSGGLGALLFFSGASTTAIAVALAIFLS